MPNSAESALEYLTMHQERYLLELQEFLRIPSISSDPTHRAEMQEAASWLAGRLRVAGFDQVRVFSTNGQPIVYGEKLAGAPSAPTVLIYGHYDVQRAEPLEDWESEPFEPVIRGNNLYARGATDMKGQIMASIGAAESLLQAGNLPLKVKFLVEGEEEVGSSHLAGFLSSNLDRLRCDVVLNPDAGMPKRDTPAIVYSLRGGAGFELHVFGPAQDLHSGTFGGVVHNPIHALSQLVAGLHDANGRITLPDFYESVRSLGAAERKQLARLPMNEEHYLEQSGAPALWGEPDFTALERTGARPSLDVVQLRAGQPKSAIPASATAYISFRLVPDQKPEEVHQQFIEYLRQQAPPTISWELEFLRGHPPVLVDRNSVAAQAMSRALANAWHKEPLFHRVGGSIPAVAMFQEILGVDSVLTGFALPEDNLHGPNEKLHLPTWRKGTEALVHFFTSLSGP